jgi:hypothetical protein
VCTPADTHDAERGRRGAGERDRATVVPDVERPGADAPLHDRAGVPHRTVVDLDVEGVDPVHEELVVGRGRGPGRAAGREGCVDLGRLEEPLRVHRPPRCPRPGRPCAREAGGRRGIAVDSGERDAGIGHRVDNGRDRVEVHRSDDGVVAHRRAEHDADHVRPALGDPVVAGLGVAHPGLEQRDDDVVPHRVPAEEGGRVGEDRGWIREPTRGGGRHPP